MYVLLVMCRLSGVDVVFTVAAVAAAVAEGDLALLIFLGLLLLLPVACFAIWYLRKRREEAVVDFEPLSQEHEREQNKHNHKHQHQPDRLRQKSQSDDFSNSDDGDDYRQGRYHDSGDDYELSHSSSYEDGGEMTSEFSDEYSDDSAY